MAVVAAASPPSGQQSENGGSCWDAAEAGKLSLPAFAYAVRLQLRAAHLRALKSCHRARSPAAREQVAEKEGQRRELAARCEQLEARLGPLGADKAELAGRLAGLERRLRDADAAKASLERKLKSAE